ncbi:hypothetical protein L7F22_053789 [Adiantum nelumboides]|nr:hypothetical protein [Adiantum nelumboides]
MRGRLYYLEHGGHTGAQVVQFRLINRKGRLQDLVWQRRRGGEDGGGKTVHGRVLQIEEGKGSGGQVSVRIDLEVRQASREDEEISRVKGLLEEGVVGGDEIGDEGALRQVEELVGARVHVGRVHAFGLEVEAAYSHPHGVERRNTCSAHQVDGNAELHLLRTFALQQRALEVEARYIVSGLARKAVEGGGLTAVVGHAKVLQGVLICSVGKPATGATKNKQQHYQH